MTVDMKTLSRLPWQHSGPGTDKRRSRALSVFIPPQSLGLVCQLNTCQFCLDHALKAGSILFFHSNLISTMVHESSE